MVNIFWLENKFYVILDSSYFELQSLKDETWHVRRCLLPPAFSPPTSVDAAPRLDASTTNATAGSILETAGGTTATWGNDAPTLEFCLVAGKPIYTARQMSVDRSWNMSWESYGIDIMCSWL